MRPGRLPIPRRLLAPADHIEETTRHEPILQVHALSLCRCRWCSLLAFVFGYPLVRIFEFSFKMVRGIDGPWIGLRNYELILSQDLFWESVRHNLFLLLAVPVMVVWSLLISVVLYERVKGWKLYRDRPVPALHPGDPDHRRRDEEDVPVQRTGERGPALAAAWISWRSTGSARPTSPCGR